MNVISFAQQVINMDNPEKRKMAIDGLKNGIKKEKLWNDTHREQVKMLIAFLETDSTNLDDLRNKFL